MIRSALRSRPRWPLGLAATLLAATACSSSSGQSIPLPAGAPTVVVSMDEYAFHYDPQIPAGRVVFRFDNVGDLPHRVTMVPLTEDVPPIAEQLRSAERLFLAPFAGIPDRRPGFSGAFAVDLIPGVRYAFICFVVDADDESHASKGMASEFRAVDGSTAEAPSTTSADE